MNWTRILGKLDAARYILQSKIYPSYSQAGEDQLIRYLFQSLGIEDPTYLDIGANHPYICSNTFLFYSRGSKGVCIEPDEDCFTLLKKCRRRDILLQAAISSTPGTAELYVFPDPYTGWNTLSKTEAESRQQQTGIQIRKVTPIPVLHINDVMSKYFNPHPNLLSLDVEGLDLEILESIDFDKHCPEVICVETITFSMNQEEQKISEIASFLLSKNYFIFGDTHVNTIFCHRDFYKKQVK
ncbi:MAG TPA: FkbM family methyltransferase [Flavitalea sp.]|nr:FkbM family methyltransferase [Flavitalea sp.]